MYSKKTQNSNCIMKAIILSLPDKTDEENV